MSLFTSPSRRRRTARPRLEVLERRDLPSAVGELAPQIDLAPLAGTTPWVVYTPGQVRHAYGFDRVSYTGAGQTIAVVVAYDDSNLLNDVAVFDRQFGLPGQTAAQVAGFLTRVSQTGSRTALPAPNVNWAVETALDVEWAHAIAPQARILLVEASSAFGGDLLAAVDFARRQSGVSVVSMSWGSREFAGEAGYDGVFTTPPGHAGVTFVAAAGDSGAACGPEWPSVSPNVLAVGGTTLRLTGNALRAAETAWSGGGGGVSSQEGEPAYQRVLQSSGRRVTPDVSYDADPATGVYVYSSFGAAAGRSGWYGVGGTSAGAPQWSALIALVNQARAQFNRPPVGDVHAALYGLPLRVFFDVTAGSNGYRANPGYDAASGRGAPVVDQFIAALLNAPVGVGVGATGGVGVGAGARLVMAAGAVSDGPAGDARLLPAFPPRQEPPAGDAVWVRFDRDFSARAASPLLDALAAERARQAAQDPGRRQVFLSGGGETRKTERDTWPDEERPEGGE
jgi:subtilase family serine protease